MSHRKSGAKVVLFSELYKIFLRIVCDFGKNRQKSWHLSQKAGADEGIEAEIGLVAAGVGVDGGFGFGLLELGFEAVLPVLERNKVFGRRREVRRKRRVGRLGGLRFEVFGSHENTLGLGTSGFETKLMLQFLAFRGILLPVARIENLVRFGFGGSDDFAVCVTVILAAVDGSVLGECAADFLNGVLINDRCHVNEGVWDPPKLADTLFVIYLRCPHKVGQG